MHDHSEYKTNRYNLMLIWMMYRFYGQKKNAKNASQINSEF